MDTQYYTFVICISKVRVNTEDIIMLSHCVYLVSCYYFFCTLLCVLASTFFCNILSSVPDQTTRISGLPLKLLIPDTQQYITYEGSFTQPGCYESVTWILFNRPIRILKQQLAEFRKLNQKGEDDPETLLEENYRPTMPVNNRPIRTNINFVNPTKSCTMRVDKYYDVTPKKKQLQR
ncbi:hypothetical protein KUTeg_020439 [Tegillarca granosa]|uniref:carbonic anhydrase n=1 Tax=Tegillarca granosa TaxID=220873 RepID=A0ABQ9ED08_TEGGR|nr:hypothetical protein KUTeg_020439 [Tegillarca granosa]